MNKKLEDFEDDKIILSGVINISPDSYYEKSIINNKKDLSEKIEEFKEYDVDYIDVGAMSTKPVSIYGGCLLYTSPSPRDATLSRMPSSA